MLKLSNLRPEIDGKQHYLAEKASNKKENKYKKEDRPLKRIEEFVYKNGKILEEEIKVFFPDKKEKTLVESSRKSKFEVILDVM
jgi:polyhydroxyalkanoate synthesis regulator protein